MGLTRKQQMAAERYQLLASDEEWRRRHAERSRSYRKKRLDSLSEEERQALRKRDREAQTKWRHEHPEKVMQHHKNAAPRRAAKYVENRDERRKQNRERYHIPEVKQRRADEIREQRYHVSPGRFAEMLMEQGGRCLVCGVHYTECKNAFSVDHDHGCCPGDRSCGKCVRGLLCHACNVGLGYFKDSIKTLQRAVLYLKRFINKDTISMTTNNLFAGLRDAKTFERGTWLKGSDSGFQYEVRVKRAIFKKTRAKGDAFILEFSIEKSDYENAKAKAIRAFGTTSFSMQELEKTLPNQAASSASWYQSMKDIDIGFGALKSFAASILGQKPDDPGFIEEVEGFMNAVVNDGLINGMLIPVEVVMVKTKSDGDFSLHKWGQIIEEPAATA